MYFGLDTYDDYYIEKNNNNNNNIIDYCFICYEIRCGDETYPIKLNSNIYYIKNCVCDGYIHKKCLDLWYNNYPNCPICRIDIEKRTHLFTLLFCNNRHTLFMYLTIKNNTKIIVKFLFLFIFFYYTLEIYLLINNTNYFSHHDFMCNSNF